MRAHEIRQRLIVGRRCDGSLANQQNNQNMTGDRHGESSRHCTQQRPFHSSRCITGHQIAYPYTCRKPIPGIIQTIVSMLAESFLAVTVLTVLLIVGLAAVAKLLFGE